MRWSRTVMVKNLCGQREVAADLLVVLAGVQFSLMMHQCSGLWLISSGKN